MNVATAIEPVTALKTKSAQLIKEARDSGQPVIITQNGKASAVLQDVESYEEQRRALLMLKLLSQGDQEIVRGKGVKHSDVRQRMEKQLKEMQIA
ncbi:MAG: type II toxin-antitoxin system Phd/YefM family antitoxin [Pontiellaceae bacterium]|nr:type II toxin-antitoxin system Phd/YefM family antitoxin [Pontiellaceae bacterium]